MFLSVWMTIVNTHRVGMKNNIPSLNFLLQAVGIVGFVTMQWLI